MKSVGPAICVLIMFCTFLVWVLEIIFRFFVADWCTIRFVALGLNDLPAPMVSRPSIDSAPSSSVSTSLLFNTELVRTLRYCVVLAFIGLAILINVVYVTQRTKLNGVRLLFLQFGWITGSACLRYVIPLISNLFDTNRSTKHKEYSKVNVTIMALLVAILDLVLPLAVSLPALPAGAKAFLPAHF